MSRNNTKINNISDNILLLDNEFDVVAMFMLTLERHGFQSVGFTEPLLALEHFQKNSEKYAFVISDVRMPVINGYQFIKEVKEIKREVKVFFMSAFDIDYVQFRRELPFEEIDEFIQKLISPTDFIMAVTRLKSSAWWSFD